MGFDSAAVMPGKRALHPIGKALLERWTIVQCAGIAAGKNTVPEKYNSETVLILEFPHRIRNVLSLKSRSEARRRTAVIFIGHCDLLFVQKWSGRK